MKSRQPEKPLKPINLGRSSVKVIRPKSETMKRTYAFILAGSLMAATALTSCGTENTTGVDTETTENEVDGMPNEEPGGDTTNENISPMDTSTTQTDTTTGM